MIDAEVKAERTRRSVLRIAAAVTLALAFSLGVYLLLDATRPDSGLVSFSFPLLVPAAVSAFVAFRERIVEWRPGERIDWRFIFARIDGWRFTDRHLIPDSAYFRVATGGYSLEPLGPGRTRLVIETRYWLRTPVNGYSALWGEIFLGDLENNLLALVKARAERAAVRG